MDTSARILQESAGSVIDDLGKIPYDGASMDIHSVFGQLKWETVKKYFYVLIGGRLDNYSSSGTIKTPRLGFIFQPTQEDVLKTLYGRAFKAPTSTMLYGQTMVYYGNEDLVPQTIDVYMM